MKKIVFLLFVIVVTLAISFKKKEILIPNEAIRIRVIANSNSLEDQKIKSDIKHELIDTLFNKIRNVDNYEVANSVIEENLLDINDIVSKYTSNYKINFSDNYFPEKEYKGVVYEEGEYPSLVITLGSGKGDNFWCVLFPPLCLIDDEKMSNNEYKFLIKDLLNKTY